MAVPVVEGFSNQVSNGTASSLDIAYPAGLLIDEYTGTIVTSNWADWTGNTFLANGQPIGKASFELERSTATAGRFRYQLYAHTGTFGVNGVPTGSALLSTEWADYTVAPVTNASVELDFIGSIDTIDGTPYCVVCEEDIDSGTIRNRIDTAGLDDGNGVFNNSGSWNSVNTNDNFSVSTPDITAGELLLIIIMNDDATGGVNTPFQIPTDWEEIANVQNGSFDCGVGVFIKTSNGTETGSETVNSNGGNDEHIGWMLRISNAGGNFKLMSTQGAVASSITPSLSPDDASSDNSLLFLATAFDGGNGLPFATSSSGTEWDFDPIPTDQELQENTDGNTSSGCWVYRDWTGSSTSNQNVQVTASSNDGLQVAGFQIKESGPPAATRRIFNL